MPAKTICSFGDSGLGAFGVLKRRRRCQYGTCHTLNLKITEQGVPAHLVQLYLLGPLGGSLLSIDRPR